MSGESSLDGFDGESLVAQFGSPLFVYDASALRRSYRRLRAAFSQELARVHFAAVCNPNLALLKILREEGAGLHANTPGDVFCGLRAGFHAADIVCSGSNLGEDDLTYLLERGVFLNVDSLDDLARACRLGPGRAIGLRLHFEDVMPPSRVGIRPAELPEARRILDAHGCRLDSFHIYCGTHGHGVDRFRGPLTHLAELAVAHPTVSTLNLGGGFAFDYEHPEAEFPFGDLAVEAERAVALVEGRRGDAKLRLRVEPGRALIAGAGLLLTRVRSVKVADGRRYVGLDTTVANLTSMPVHGTHRRALALTARPPHGLPADLCGCTTYSRDIIAKGISLPDVHVNDLLAVLDTGAYGYCMASHFLNRPKPAEVVLDGGVARLVTRRQTFEDLLGAQLEPAGETTPVEAHDGRPQAARSRLASPLAG